MVAAAPAMDSLFEGTAGRRVAEALARVLRHQPRNIAVAGSLALAAQTAARGHPPARTFGDIDLLVPSFDVLEDTLATEFLCAHVHPDVQAGRVFLQLVHPGDHVRIDIFHAHVDCLSRATTFQFQDRGISVVSLEDQAAHAAALCMKLDRGGSVSGKHFRDLRRMAPLIEEGAANRAWWEHRSEADPERFEDAVALVRRRVEEYPDHLIDPVFATDVDTTCPRCRTERSFRPAPRGRVFEILGFV